MNKIIALSNIKSEKATMYLVFLFLLIFPFIGSAYDVLNMSYFISMTFLSVSLWLIWGLTGIFSFGQTAFFGVGAYSYALISMNFENSGMTIVALLLALLIAWLSALLLGYFMFYGGVNDVFVGLITLCVTLVLSTFLAQTAGSEWKIGSVLLGGDNGINNIPPISIGSLILQENSLYYFIIISALALYFLLLRLKRTKLGFSFIAVRENRERSKLLGYNIPFLQTLAFSFGGILAAFSGILYVIWGGYISPAAMDISAAALPVVLVAAAGRSNLSAVMIFTGLYYYFSQKISVIGGEFALVMLGITLILVILIVPQGIVVTLFNQVDRLLAKVNRGSKNETKITPDKTGTE